MLQDEASYGVMYMDDLDDMGRYQGNLNRLDNQMPIQVFPLPPVPYTLGFRKNDLDKSKQNQIKGNATVPVSGVYRSMPIGHSSGKGGTNDL
jgi:hypothetical protein